MQLEILSPLSSLFETINFPIDMYIFYAIYKINKNIYTIVNTKKMFLTLTALVL